MYITRYRVDINDITHTREYVEETWEPVLRFDREIGLHVPAMRLIDQHRRVSVPLDGWELEAVKAGWTPPDHFTYVAKLPPSVAAAMEVVSAT